MSFIVLCFWCLSCIDDDMFESIIISGGIGCDWSVCGFLIVSSGGFGITGFTGVTSFCLIGGVGLPGFGGLFDIIPLDIIDCIIGVIKSVEASVNGFTGCLSLIP